MTYDHKNWHREPRCDHEVWEDSKAIVNGHTETVAHVTRGWDDEEGERIANLIAAAPDLEKSLEGMIDAYWIGSEDSDDEHAPTMVKDAFAALKKARGETTIEELRARIRARTTLMSSDDLMKLGSKEPPVIAIIDENQIGERLRMKRYEREEEEQAKRDAAPRGDGMALVLADVVEAEKDANDDIFDGLPVGTHAKWREDSKIARAKADEFYRQTMAQRDEDEAADPTLREERVEVEKKAKAKADKENETWWRKNGHKYRSRERKADKPRSHTYHDGRRAAEDVSLDR